MIVTTRQLSWAAALCVAVLMAMQTGCEPTPEGATNEERMAIENVAKWYQLYKSKNRGKPPKDEASFMAFIEKGLEGRSDAGELDKLMISPRDGQKYVVLYGSEAGKSKNMDKNVAVYEQTGAGGTKLVAFEAAWAKEVSDSELESLLSSH